MGLHSEPGFVSNLRNVTVPEGRDVTLSCTVKNLQEHKVGFHKMIYQEFFLMWQRNYVTYIFHRWRGSTTTALPS